MESEIAYYSLLLTENDIPEGDYDTINEAIRYHDRNGRRWNFIVTLFKDINLEKFLKSRPLSQVVPIPDVTDPDVRRIYKLN